jgi:hypothetical protein
LFLETQRKKYAGYNMPFDYTVKIGAGLQQLGAGLQNTSGNMRRG